MSSKKTYCWLAFTTVFVDYLIFESKDDVRVIGGRGAKKLIELDVTVHDEQIFKVCRGSEQL